MVRVKICGIKTEEDARAVALAGADAVGFHIGLSGGRSPLEVSNAAGFIQTLPETTASVAVTSLSKPEALIELAHTSGATTLQLYGDTTPEQVKEVKETLPSIEIWKVINVFGEEGMEQAKRYDGVVDAIVLDKAQSAQMKGGSGQTLDWDIARKIVEAVSTPVILAGGLNPENVAEAVRIVKPYGVDVNSGVSNPDGSKDLEKVKSFIDRAKG